MDGLLAAVTLGVDPRANRDELRRAFRARARRVHPDAPSGSPEAFLALRAALDLLWTSAPEAPSPLTTGCPSPAGAWMVAGEGRRPTVDCRDVARVVPVAGPVGSADPRFGPAIAPVDHRGLTFEDHLAAALADREAVGSRQ